MAKVTAPLFSLDASGTIGKAFTFSKWKGRNYVRTRVSPYNPKSTGQTTQRTAFSSAVTVWQGMSSGEKDNWNARARGLGLVMSGYNFYVQQYLDQGGVPTMP
ncbi:MAG: hypothetical protein U5R06_02310 [candidate division KSB1 bacterium]|nr:hypothetical protein [candidate division KSB1 bacterium]